MGYIVCEKCGGYYELQPGESSEDPQNLRFWDPENEVFEGFSDKCECEGDLRYVQELNDVDESQTNKIKSKFMNFQSVVSIILGAIISFILFGILSYVFEVGTAVSMITMIITLILGGFIATFFSKEKKIRYGVYSGAGLLVINIIFLTPSHLFGITVLIAEFFTIFLFTSIGGFLGGIASKRLKRSSDLE